MSLEPLNNFIKKNNAQPKQNIQQVFKELNTDNSIFLKDIVKNHKPDIMFDDHGMPFSDKGFDFSFVDNIPEGHSHYEYNGATYDIYRKGEEYKDQFVHPDDISREDFIEYFPYLEPVVNPAEDNSGNSAKTVAGVNGEIDEETIQGSTGDCWLISTLYSMCNSEKGKEIIKNAIKVNDDNTVTVSFNGIGVSYTMTPEEISQFDTDNNTSDEYSNGDNDVLVMELAVQKLWKDIESGRVQLNTNNKDIAFSGNGAGISEGGLPSQLLYYLTGVEPTQLYNNDLSDLSQNQIYEQLQKAYQSGNYSLTFGLYGNGHKAKLTNGENFELDLGKGGHALAITDVQKDTVTFVNPWDTSKKYTMSWEEFSKLGVGYMCSSDLSQTKYADKVVDMTDESNYINRTDYDSNVPSRNYNRRKGSGYSYKDNGSFNIFDYFKDLIEEILYSNKKRRLDKTKNKK